jgi:hypothetical protein
MVGKTAALGSALTLAVGLGFWGLWSREAALAGAVFGALATGLQVGAVATVRPVLGAPFSQFIRRWGIGMGLRLLGVAAIAVAVLVNRETFPPLPTAFGFLAVLVPLLFFEARLVR